MFSLQPGSRESHGPSVGGGRKGFLKREPPRKALVSEFASFIHERSTTKHSDWLEIPWKVNFLMLIMVEITLLSNIFRLFFFSWGTMSSDFPRGKGHKGLFFRHSYLQHHYTTTLPTTLLMKNVICTPDLHLFRSLIYRRHLQCGQTGKSTECVFINVSDPVEG